MADIKAIDVSAHQESIDWKKVASTGVKVAILRCTAGSSDLKVKDSYFEKNYAGATKNGIKVGVYRYSYAKTLADIKTEANGVVAALKGKTIQYPVFLDLEWEWQQKNLSKTQLGDFIDAFRTIIEKAGYIFGIYCNLNWLNNILPASAKNHPLWVARYPYEDKGVIREDLRIDSSDFKNCIGWQYSSKGKVSGINGNVDMDVFYKDYAAGKKEAPKKSIEEVAKEVISGDWGNGDERKRRLTDAGYDYDKVQAKVNEILGAASKKEVESMPTRSDYVKTAQKYVGAKKGSSLHHKIIDIFNKVKPDGWAMTYSAPWCAASVSAWAIECFGVTNAKKLFPLSANCGTIISKAKKMGIWVEKDSYKPDPGDWILYDWDDSGRGDNTGGPEHVGMVEKVTNNVITVIEGNMTAASKVGRRALAVNGRYIRGFVCPKFGSQSTKKEESSKTSSSKKTSTVDKILASYKVGKVYTVKVDNLNVRTGAGTSFSKKTKKQLTADGQKHSNKNGQLMKGTEVTCLAKKKNGSNVWIQIPSGWVCAYYGTAKEYYVK